jgi:predicted dehydrogenase
MRIAIAGLGAAALRGHLPALTALESEGKATIVGGCDPDQQRCAAVQRAFPGVPTFASATEMLASVRSELLAIAAHPDAHAELARLGATHGQHILCEKPAGMTPAQVSEFVAIRRRHPDRGLVAMYQYRFSWPWILATRFLRAIVKPEPHLAMFVDVQRPVTDRHASSNWRDDPTMGGALADHAVHFLALARTLRGSLEVVSSTREYDRLGRERAKASVQVGASTLDVSVSYGASKRKTNIALNSGASTLRWSDKTLTMEQEGRRRHLGTVPTLADRGHIDALYRPMYRDLLAGLRYPAWRHRRAQELLEVSQCLTALLAQAGAVEPAGQMLPLAA